MAATSYIRILAAAWLLLIGTAGLAQSADQYITWGDRAMAMGEHYGASRFYAEALKIQPGILDLEWKYAEACRQSHQYEEAAYLYGKVHKKDQGRRYPEALRWLAEMQMSSGRYAEALKSWPKVKQKERDKKSAVAQRAENGLEGCRLAQTLLPDSTVEVEHIPMPVNSFASEFAGRTGPDSALYFTSLRGELNADGEVQDTAGYRARIYRAEEQGGRWLEPVALAGPVNAGGNNANGTWSLDGRWFYFSREGQPGEFAIHAVDLAGRADSTITVLQVPGHTVTQPMVAFWDGLQRMLFTSDMPGGQGGMDLWWGVLSAGELTDLRPIDPALNTPGNETGPWLDSSDSTLYFSSDFLPGLGGYDLFRIPMGRTSTAVPENLGPPYNSPANDLYPAINKAAGTGWFTSNRSGSFAARGETCCNDLYRLSWPGLAPPVPPVEETDSMAVAIIREKQITSLREKLPIRLYFHNDEPNPRSWNTATDLDYGETFRSYKAIRPEYDAAWQDMPDGIQSFDRFFEQEVEGNFAKLNDFIDLLGQALAEGQVITLVIRGYASPLAKSDYNKNLSLRRIKSLVNYLERTGNGQLLPYLRNTADNGGRLIIEEQPYGKSTADASVSDRLDDLRHSVYSVGAAKERRIEIEQVIGEW